MKKTCSRCSAQRRDMYTSKGRLRANNVCNETSATAAVLVRLCHSGIPYISSTGDITSSCFPSFLRYTIPRLHSMSSPAEEPSTGGRFARSPAQDREKGSGQGWRSCVMVWLWRWCRGNPRGEKSQYFGNGTPTSGLQLLLHLPSDTYMTK